MKKRLSSFLLALCLMVTPSIGVRAETSSGIDVTVNGNPVVWTDAEPFIDENNRTMVPLRAVAEALGLNIYWDGEVREATFSNDSKAITFPIGQSVAWTNKGEFILMDTAAVIVNDRTYAPIRYLATFFEYDVAWDDATKTVRIREGIQYYLTASYSTLTVEEGESITIVLQHNCPGARVFSSQPNFDYDTGRVSIGYEWYDDYSIFELHGRQVGDCVVQFYYGIGGQVIYSDKLTVTCTPSTRTSQAPLSTLQAISDIVIDAMNNEQNALLMCQSAMTAVSANYGKYYAERAQEFYAKIVTEIYDAIDLCGDYEDLSDMKVPLATIYGINVYGASYTITTSNYLEYAMETSIHAGGLVDYYNEVLAILTSRLENYRR